MLSTLWDANKAFLKDKVKKLNFFKLKKVNEIKHDKTNYKNLWQIFFFTIYFLTEVLKIKFDQVEKLSF